MQRPIPAPIPSPARRGGRSLPAPLGEILREKGLVDQEGLERALALKRQQGMKLGQALVELKLLSEAGLSEVLRWQGRVPCVALTPKIVDGAVARELPLDTWIRLGSIALNRIGGVVTVAVDDPSDLFVIDELQRLLGGRVFAVHAESARIRECQQAVFQGASNSMSLRDLGVGRLNVARRQEPVAETNAWDIRKQVPELMRSILEGALAGEATSVHFEPRPGALAVRMRLRQGLREKQALPAEWGPKCVAWLRELVGLSPESAGSSAEGRGTIELGGNEHLALVSVAPGPHGDVATVRLRPRSGARVSLEALDLEPADGERLTGLLSHREGLVLCVGPTGSGVTTTLHASLRQLVRPDRKLVTLEDPIEALFDGVVQVEASSFRGRPQSSALRALVRHDPDVLLVAELEDEGCFSLIEQAASAGVLVLLGMRAAGAGRAFEQLWRLGADPYSLTQSLRGMVVCTAFPVPCQSCRVEQPLGPNQLVELDRRGMDPNGLQVHRGKGCEACQGRGVRGTQFLREVVSFDAELQQRSFAWSTAAHVDAALFAKGHDRIATRALAAARAGTLCAGDLLRHLPKPL